MPIPGSAVSCRGPHCGVFVTVGQPDVVPAWKLTGNKRSRGFYCADCAERLGWKGCHRPTPGSGVVDPSYPPLNPS